MNRQILAQNQEGRQRKSRHSMQLADFAKTLMDHANSISPLLQMVFLLLRAEVKWLCSVRMQRLSFSVSVASALIIHYVGFKAAYSSVLHLCLTYFKRGSATS